MRKGLDYIAKAFKAMSDATGETVNDLNDAADGLLEKVEGDRNTGVGVINRAAGYITGVNLLTQTSYFGSVL